MEISVKDTCLNIMYVRTQSLTHMRACLLYVHAHTTKIIHIIYDHKVLDILIHEGTITSCTIAHDHTKSVHVSTLQGHHC